MGQSLVKNYVHIIFATKGRQPIITKELENDLKWYFKNLSVKLESQLLAAGGNDDHIHILVLLSKKMCLSNFVNIIKRQSSKWVKNKEPHLFHFAWQNGYGAFSVSESAVLNVKKYIFSQREHHKKLSFKEEYIQILKENHIPYDERYLWD